MQEVSFGEAMQRKYPEWVVLVVTSDEEGKVDIMPAGWAMIVSHKPPMFAVAVGHERHTHQRILDAEEFVVAFPSPGQEEDVLYAGTHSGREVDKLANTNFETAPPAKVKTPLLAGCIVNLECQLAGRMVTGDHTIFAGRVVAAHIEESVTERLVNFGDNRFATARPGS